MADTTPLRILAWPLSSPNNNYPRTLNDYLGARANVTGFVRGKAMLGKVLNERFDILQIHWLEAPFWTPRGMTILKYVVFALLSVAILKLRGTRIVWTAHDPEPHEMQANVRIRHGALGLLWRAYQAFMIRWVDGLILLSRSHHAGLVARYPSLAAKPYAVIPHPHYKGVYPDGITRTDARTRLGMDGDDRSLLLFLGNMRPYKNADGLIAAFRQSDADARLLLAGKADSEDYARKLNALAHGDDRIHLILDYVADEELQIYLRAADVAIIPFRDVTNSGSVALALSFDCPVAVPNVPVFCEVRDTVGHEWVYLFDGPLAAADIDRIITWATAPNRTPRPDLDSYDWDSIADASVRFFEALHDKP